MQRWDIRDSQGHEIYLTAERWEHIQDRHPELIGRLDDGLDAIRRGRREQDAILPNKSEKSPLVHHQRAFTLYSPFFRPCSPKVS